MTALTEAQMLGGGLPPPPHVINNSCLFDSGASAHMTWTPGTAGNRKTWTAAFWLKLGNLTPGFILTAGTNLNNHTRISYSSAGRNEIEFRHTSGSVTQYLVSISARLRDTHGWTQVEVAVDTTQPVAADRVKIRVCGDEGPYTDTNYPAQNFDTYVNAAVEHRLGDLVGGGSNFFDGAMADPLMVDGQQLAPGTVGQFDTINTRVWKPKAYTGAYGTNGWRLDFENAAALGDDASGNDNHWTPVNMTSANQLADNPNDNFCVLSPIASNATLSAGNLDATIAPTQGALGSLAARSGKFYWEINAATVTPTAHIGIARPSLTAPGALTADVRSYRSDGQKFDGLATAYGAAYTNGDRIGVALDLDAGELRFFKNGVDQGPTPANDYSLIVETGNHFDAAIMPSGGGNTFTYWLKVNTLGTTGSYRRIIQDAAATSLRWNAHIFQSAPPNLRLEVYFGDGGTQRSTVIGDCTQGVWCHITAVQNADSSVDTYIDGVPGGSISQTNLQLQPSDLVGLEPNNGIEYEIDRLRVWDRALGAAEVAALAADQFDDNIDRTSLIHEYYFNQSLADSAGTADFAVIAGTPTYASIGGGGPPEPAFTGLTGLWLPYSVADDDGGTQRHVYAFEAADFVHAVPAGHEVLSTKKLADPDVPDPQNYADVLLDTGNGGVQSRRRTSFPPDVAIIKSRTAAGSWVYTGKVRGLNKQYNIDLPSDENTAPDAVTAWHNDGIDVGAGAGLANGSVNVDQVTYMTWLFRELTGFFDELGFSGTGIARDVAHSLGVPPEFLYLCSNNPTDDWANRFDPAMPATDALRWNTDIQAFTDATYWDNTAPNAATLRVGSSVATNRAGTDNIVGGVFATKSGLCAVGSYIGNGSTDGPFIYCDGRPLLVMIKRLPVVGNWLLYDRVRDPINPVTKVLYPSLDNAEVAFSELDFLSTGFKLRGANTAINTNGSTYAFLAILDGAVGGATIPPMTAH